MCERQYTSINRSPSSRRAWIEILPFGAGIGLLYVALLTEGVDRNVYELNHSQSVYRRPPHGGRG